ncbi:MAG: N-acetyltransferase family protein [Dehalococcoidia bacterium]|nr:N-acetyltransferase family protein [Dehalococcoidia bacterium]
MIKGVATWDTEPWSPEQRLEWIREDTLYVRPEFQGRGVRRALLAEARRLGVHAVLARIEATNEASISLHRALGFEVTGHERESGHKFGEWRSLAQMQIVLPILLPDEPGTSR